MENHIFTYEAMYLVFLLDDGAILSMLALVKKVSSESHVIKTALGAFRTKSRNMLQAVASQFNIPIEILNGT